MADVFLKPKSTEDLMAVVVVQNQNIYKSIGNVFNYTKTWSPVQCQTHPVSSREGDLRKCRHVIFMCILFIR